MCKLSEDWLTAIKATFKKRHTNLTEKYNSDIDMLQSHGIFIGHREKQNILQHEFRNEYSYETQLIVIL